MTVEITRFAVRNLLCMREALDHHNATCGTPARAFLLNPIDHGLLGWTNLWGVPVQAEGSVRVKTFRIDCSDYEPQPSDERQLVHSG